MDNFIDEEIYNKLKAKYFRADQGDFIEEEQAQWQRNTECYCVPLM